ncbi:MAG TPA: FAD-linked oxidase C-terminal domain-containing protein [Acidobacteriota bacterium]|jgi:FAD/FMN-containing dehydrogenase/Fe-S oxidoreductase
MFPEAVPQADAAAVDVAALQGALTSEIEGEVRFDPVSRALYSTDASIYQIRPLGVVVVKSRQDVVRTVQICSRFHCPMTIRGGGTSQAGQAVGAGIQIDTSKYLNRILEVNVRERWAWVETGVVLDDLNAHLRSRGLKFAPDVSTSNRATIGGMMANNSSGARSVIYGKTIDHVLEQHVVLSDGKLAHFRALSEDELQRASSGTGVEADGCRLVQQLARSCAAEIDRRFPRILRRVGGYNLDAFARPDQPFNLCNLMVGSEGTLGLVVQGKIQLVPLPAAKAVLVVHFHDLLAALKATPLILTHRPAAIEVLDSFILDSTRHSASLQELRDFITGNPEALLLVEFYGDSREEVAARVSGLESELAHNVIGYHTHRAFEERAQERIWRLRKAALGLSMAMKGDSKAISFVEDTAVAPEKLRDYIERFLSIIREHGTTAGVYAHASVGCLHVRPVINLKTEHGIRQFESIAGQVADLVLEYGGALSGEHGDGLVRGPFTLKMFGPVLYEAFRSIKRTFDPAGIFNPGKIVDAPPLTSNLRYGASYRTPDPPTYFDYSDHGGFGRAVEMCSGLGACRKKLDGTMCPSYMATLEEAHSTRGRANVLRLALSGRLGEAGLKDDEVLQVLDLCLECRACKSECPVSVDMARFKSEFLAAYWGRHRVPLRARLFGNIHKLARWGSRCAPLSGWVINSRAGRRAGEILFGIDARRSLPPWSRCTLAATFQRRSLVEIGSPAAEVVLFNDTFTNYYEPEIGISAVELLEQANIRVRLAPYSCCGRPLISQGLLEQAKSQAEATVETLLPLADQGRTILFCEPSCLSAVREDIPALLGRQSKQKAQRVADACMLLEHFLQQQVDSGRIHLSLRAGPKRILLHAHCHQKAMGLAAAAQSLLSRIPSCEVIELDAGCCGMAGSFGYLRSHYEISRKIAERRLIPAVLGMDADSALVASGTSCRHQVEQFSGRRAVHPAVLLRSLMV